MKYFIPIFLFAVLSVSVSAQTNNIFSAGLCHTNGVPNFNPGSRGCRIALDTTTQHLYVWKVGTTWVDMGSSLQPIAGCAAPAYTPTKWQSPFVINSCAAPELYYHAGGGVWDCLNCAAGGATNLSWTEVSSIIYRLNSSTGNDVFVREGSGVTAALSGDTLTFTATGGGGGTVTTDATLDGDGSGGDPLKIAQQSAASSQVLMWTGATWEPSWGNPYTFVTTGATITTAVNEILIGTIAGNVTMGLPTCDATTSGKRFKFVRNGTDTFSITIEPGGIQQFYPATDRVVHIGPVSIDCTCALVGGTYFWFYDNF